MNHGAGTELVALAHAVRRAAQAAIPEGFTIRTACVREGSMYAMVDIEAICMYISYGGEQRATRHQVTWSRQGEQDCIKWARSEAERIAPAILLSLMGPPPHPSGEA